MNFHSEFLFLSNPESEYERTINEFMKSRRYEPHAKQYHRKQLMQFAMDEKFIDSPLTPNARAQVDKIKQKLYHFKNVSTIIVAPLRKSLETCEQILKDLIKSEESKKIHVYIEPTISDRLNSSHSIGYFPQEDQKTVKGYQEFIINAQAYLKDDEWIFDILPVRVKEHLPNKERLSSGLEYFKLLKNSKFAGQQKSQEYELQTKEEFCQRLEIAKQKLQNYNRMSGSHGKVIVVGSSQALNILGATGYHQNGDPVNPLRMECGDVEQVTIIKEGDRTYEVLQIEQSLPFCG